MPKKKTTQSIVELARPEIPLASAAALMASVMNRIDNAEDLDDAVIAEFKQHQLEEAHAIDETICFRGFLDAGEAHADQVIAKWIERKQQFAKIRDSLDNQIKKTLKENPDRIFRGTIGQLKLRKNPPSLKTAWGSTAIDESVVEMFGIDEEFYEIVPPPPPPPPKYKLKTNEVKAAITNQGREIEWATTEQSEKVEVST
jgi:hypothetical protein